MEEIFETLIKLNWYELLETFIRYLSGVRSWKFVVARDCGFSRQQIEKILAKFGVKVWGRGGTHGTLTFNVEYQQADWAEYLLWQHGITVYSPPFNVQNSRNGKQNPFNPRNSQLQNEPGWVDSLLSFLLR